MRVRGANLDHWILYEWSRLKHKVVTFLSDHVAFKQL